MARKKRPQRARARAREDAEKKTPEMVRLCVSEIAIDSAWNVRDAMGSGKATEGETENPDAEFSDAEFVDDIRRRYEKTGRGLLQAPIVRPFEGSYLLVAGYRRVEACRQIDADMRILCSVQPSTGDELDDEFEASSANLAENLKRRRLQPFEIANKLYRMADARPELGTAELAEKAQLSYRYCCGLLRIRRQAVPELWAIFMRYGGKLPAHIRYRDLLDVVKRPKEKQMAEWQRIVDERTSGKPTKGDGDKKTPTRASMRQLRTFLAHLDEVGGSDEYRDGIKQGLLLALGRQSWSNQIKANA